MTTMWIGGLPPATTSEDLFWLLVLQCNLLPSEFGRMKTYNKRTDVASAHVDVYSCEARNKLQKMDALDLYNRGHLIDIRVAKPARKSSEVCAMGSILE